MSALNDTGAPLFDEAPVIRKAATLGEAGYTRNARDFYPTEPWVTRALLQAVEFNLGGSSPYADLIWEPAVGDGRMYSVLFEAGYRVIGSDIHDYGWPGTRIHDFLRDSEGWLPELPAAIVTNPPFDLARDFIRKALALTERRRGKVAILQRHEFDAPRSNLALFAAPFAAKLILPRRPWWKERKPGDDGPRFPYAWYLWDWRHQGEPVIRWLDEVPR